MHNRLVSVKQRFQALLLRHSAGPGYKCVYKSIQKCVYNVLFKEQHREPIISESGIKSEIDVEKIYKETGINNFLIGESLLKNINQKSSLIEKILKIKA